MFSSPCKFFAQGRCKHGAACKFLHGSSSKPSRALSAVPSYTGPPVAVKLSLLTTFGWRETADPADRKASDLLAHFESRLEVPGRPRVLVEPLPRSVLLRKFDDKRVCPKFDRPPVEVSLLAAQECGFDWWSSVKFVTPRRNLKASLEDSDGEVDVQRGSTGPIFMRRVISYDAVNNGDIGPQFERKLAVESKGGASDQFRSLLHLQLGAHSVLLTSEIDAVTESFIKLASDAKTNNNDLFAHIREIKSIGGRNAQLWKTRAPGIFLQSALSGTPSIVIGEKEDSFGTTTLNTIVRQTSSIVEEADQQAILGSTSDYLDWILKVTPADSKVYRIVPSARKISKSPDAEPVVSDEMLDLIRKKAKGPKSPAVAAAPASEETKDRAVDDAAALLEKLKV